MPATFTTTLPNASLNPLDASVEDELTASWPDAINYGNYRVEYRESQDSQQIEDFEDQSLDGLKEDTGDFEFETANPIAGSASLATKSTATSSQITSDGGLPRVKPGDSFSYVVRASEGTGGATCQSAFLFGVQGTDEFYSIQINHHQDNWFIRKNNGGSYTQLATQGGVPGDFDASVEYVVDVEWAKNGVITATINEGGGQKDQLVGTPDQTFGEGDLGFGVFKEAGTTITLDSITVTPAPADWLAEAVVDETTTSTVIAGLQDGENYDVRVRAETEHVTGSWSERSQVTLLLAPSNLQSTDPAPFADVYDLVLTWTDNSDNPEDEYVVEVDAGSDWTIEQAGLGQSASTYTFTGTPRIAYQFRVKVETPDSFAYSSAIGPVSTSLRGSDHYWLALVRDQTSDYTEIYDTHVMSVDIPSEHSVINEWNMTVPHTIELEGWAGADAYLWYGDSLLMDGRLDRVRSAESSETTSLSGPDSLYQLELGGEFVRYQSIAVWEAIQDYWNTYTPLTATVHEPTPTAISTDNEVQNTIQLEPAATDPVNPAGNLLQSCFFTEAESYANRSGFTGIPGGQAPNDADYSASAGQMANSNGDYIEWDFSLAYTIPADDVRVRVRGESDPSNAPALTWTLDHQNGSTYQIDTLNTNGSITLAWGWREIAEFGSLDGNGYTGPDLTPGSYTLRLDLDGSAGNYYIDAVAPYDGRYTYLFDDSVDANGYLSGPELHPDAATVPAVLYDTSFNVPSATLDIGINDPGGAQAIQLSNDQGTSWYPDDGTEQNTTSVAVTFPNPGSTVRGRVTLSRYGSRTTASPTEGYLGQSLSSWSLKIDENDLAVIDDSTYTGSHYEIIQRLHRDGGMRFVPTYSVDSLEVESFVPGDVVKTADWTTLNHERDYDIAEYANRVTAYGKLDEQTGERLVATATNQSEVDVKGLIEAPPLFLPEVGSEVNLESAARTDLAERVAQDRLAGKLSIVPKYIQPGFSYVVDELDGETLPLESVRFSDGLSDSGTLQFVEAEDIAASLGSVKSEVHTIKDAF